MSTFVLKTTAAVLAVAAPALADLMLHVPPNSGHNVHVLLDSTGDAHALGAAAPGAEAAFGFTCLACKSGIGFIEDQISSKGCDYVIANADTVCNKFGPFSSTCVSAVKKYCPVIAQAIKDHASPETVCKTIGLCDSSTFMALEAMGFPSMSATDSTCSIGWSCVIHPSDCWNDCKCAACKKIVGQVVGKIGTEGCALIDVEADGICEAIGGGPEDPIADLCAVAWDVACPKIANFVASGITDPAQLCNKVGMC